jgi:hypothetical protein
MGTSHWSSCLHFLKVYIGDPREFCFGTLGLHILCLQQLTPTLLTVYHHAPLIFNSLWYAHYIMFIYTWVISIFFIL